MRFSLDLRERVIAAIDNNERIGEVAKKFTVSKRVIYEWLELRKETGSLAAKSGYQKGHSHKIKDWDQFKIFAEANKQDSAIQMAIEWEKLTGIPISHDVITRGLKKIGFTSKKKLLITSKPVSKSVKSIWMKLAA